MEIEAKSFEGAEMLGVITADLQFMFPDDLKAWPHSKLAIGVAVEILAQTNELESLLDDQRNLKPEAYSRIDAVLSKLTRASTTETDQA